MDDAHETLLRLLPLHLRLADLREALQRGQLARYSAAHVEVAREVASLEAQTDAMWREIAATMEGDHG